MLTGIDHLVVVVRDLSVAAAGYTSLGFTVVPGGRHAVGTENALIGLQDGAYIELLAFFEAMETHRWWRPRERGGGLVDFCAATDDLPADLAALRSAGVEVDDPRPQTRTRPDGHVLRWKLAIPGERHRGRVPFLIDDETPRRERVPAATSHANHVTGLAALTIVVGDLAEARGWCERLLGTGVDGNRDDLGALAYRVRIGPHTLEFVAPARPDSRLAPFLARHGPGPYAATLTAPTRVGHWLDETAAQGARLYVL